MTDSIIQFYLELAEAQRTLKEVKGLKASTVEAHLNWLGDEFYISAEAQEPVRPGHSYRERWRKHWSRAGDLADLSGALSALSHFVNFEVPNTPQRHLEAVIQSLHYASERAREADLGEAPHAWAERLEELSQALLAQAEHLSKNGLPDLRAEREES